MTTASLNIRVDSSEVSKADRSLDDLAKSGANADKSATKLTSSTERLSSVARVAAGAFAALGASVSVREIIQASDAWQSAANQLRLVTNSASELSAVQSKLMGVSNDTRSSFESTANLYTRLTRATSEMGLSQSELIGLTTTINQSFAVSGATAAEAAAAITQLSQGLAAGALRGDEFNSVAEQAPGIMRAIADSLKMTVGELRAFAAEGGITADIVVTALQGAATSIDQDFGKSVMTFGQSMQVARNNFVEFAGTSDSISAAMSGLGKFVISASEGFDELGSAVDYTSGLIADFVEIGANGLTPFISDVYNLSVDAAEAISEFGSSVASTGATVSTGFDQLDEVVNAFFDNFSKGSVDAAEMFSLAFGTALPNTRAVIETATVAIADAVERMKVRITTSGAEQEAALAALDSIRNRSINEIIALRDEELAGLYELISAQAEERKTVSSLIDTTKEFTDETYEAWLATQDMAEGVEVLGKRVSGTDEEIKAFNKSIDEYLKQQKKNKQAVSETIGALMHEQEALGMTARMQAVFNEVTEAYNKGAAPEQIALIAQLTAENYDLAESQRIAAKEVTELGKSAVTAAKAADEAWGRTHDYMSGAFVDLMNNGGNAFDNIAKSFEQMVKRMVAEWAASKLMDVFGMKAPSGGGGGLGTIGSILGSIGKGGASQPGGVAGTMSAGAKIGSTIASAGGAIGGAVSSAGSAIMSGISAIPGWGWAIGGAALLASQLSKDETPSSNAGFLIRPVGNGDGRTFDVPAFSSGFDPVGFARREDQGAAIAVIDTFRQYDAALTQIANAAGLNVRYNSNNFGGFSEKGTGGGLFFGSASEDGKNTAVPVEQQLNQFVGQWIKGLSGQVDPSLINDVLSAGSADEMVKRAAMLAGVPAFASGGYHSGGLMLVGEQGPELINTGPSRVLSNSDTVSALKGNSDTILKQVLAELSQIRKYMATSVNIIDQWDGEGMPAVRT